MELNRKWLSGNRKYLFALMVLLFISMLCVAFSMKGSDGFEISRREVLLRRLGHELLLQSGDSTSRVLPVKKTSETGYQVRFETELGFQPDSLVNTTRRLFAKDPYAADYVVNVLNCSNSTVAYSFAVASNVKDDIVSCLGRTQPKACYIVSVKFKPAAANTARNGLLLGGLPLLALAFIGYIFLRPDKPPTVLPEEPSTGLITLGSVLFDTQNRKLLANGEATDLTATETRVLLILASSPNQMIERSRLQKEIWEDEGVIVGRSLDMFISKLRKKLEVDPDVNIVVVRGKGYRLEIST